LNPEEQRNLMELLIAMAKADGEVVDIEAQVLEQYAELIDVDLDSLDGNRSVEELATTFGTPESKVAVLQEVIRLSHLDGYFAEDEKRAILQLAGVMGIPTEFVMRVDQWVVDGLRWVWEGEELVNQANQVVTETA
jgi:uncharacterized tellurite resistance protein B-like protein